MRHGRFCIITACRRSPPRAVPVARTGCALACLARAAKAFCRIRRVKPYSASVTPAAVHGKANTVTANITQQRTVSTNKINCTVLLQQNKPRMACESWTCRLTRGARNLLQSSDSNRTCTMLARHARRRTVQPLPYSAVLERGRCARHCSRRARPQRVPKGMSGVPRQCRQCHFAIHQARSTKNTKKCVAWAPLLGMTSTHNSLQRATQMAMVTNQGCDTNQGSRPCPWSGHDWSSKCTPKTHTGTHTSLRRPSVRLVRAWQPTSNSRKC